jgi:hypothetical protein
MEHKMCALVFSINLSETVLIVRMSARYYHEYKNVVMKVPFILVRF